MIRSFLTVSSGTLASRLLGFVRDSIIAALLGAGPVADAFLVAFQLVNVVRRLLSEGGLNASLVPAWLRMREAGGASAAAAFAGRVLGTVSAALIAASVLIGLLMPLVITALAPGFAGHDTLQLAVNDARLMLPYLAFAGPVTVMMALLNAQGRFALTAFSPLLFNIALIAVMAGRCAVGGRARLSRARPRRGGGTGVAGNARPDRDERADRADAVRARRLYARRYGGDRASPDVADARPARPCAGQGAVAGGFRARGHDDAAAGDAEG